MLELTYAEVVVLHEVLHRWEEDGSLDAFPYEHSSERTAMWNLTASLEPLFDEVFSSPAEFDAIVDAARRALDCEK